MGILDQIKKLRNKQIQYVDEISDDVIKWSLEKLLTHSDFLQGFLIGESARTYTWKSIDAKAEIKLNIKGVIIYKITKIKVTAIFSRTQSWMDHTLSKFQDMDVVLHHEQRHFDIAEIYARKLQKKFDKEINREFTCQQSNSESAENAVLRTMKEFLNKHRNQCEIATQKFQDEYDDQVYPSGTGKTNDIGQIEYDKKIESMLQNS